jgi:hypothetical protein
MASLPHNDAVFSSRRTKLPAESFVFIELIQFLVLNFCGRFRRPLAPVLFSEPGIGFKGKLQVTIDDSGSIDGTPQIAAKDAIPGDAF